jgi:hypothetical protein
MKEKIILFVALIAALTGCSKRETKLAEAEPLLTEKKLFLDVHDFGPGNVNFEAVEEAHKKDLATQGEFDAEFLKYWVDEQAGKVYCLVESSSETDLFRTHNKAHGLVPDYIMEVTDGLEAKLKGDQPLFLDTHHFEPGSVTAAAVAGAHEKDLAVQAKYGVNLINYWLDEKLGTVVCLSEAPDSMSIIKTHTEAHGLIPSKVERVRQGQ